MGKSQRRRDRRDDEYGDWEPAPSPPVPEAKPTGFCKVGLPGCTVVPETYSGRLPLCGFCARSS
jgi:hypothetical protein